MRINALPYHVLSNFDFQKTLNFQKNIDETTHRAIEISETLIDLLYKQIKSTADSAIQKELLNLKRDVYNGRYKKVSESIYEKLYKKRKNC